jgi:hypothetical protein
MAISLLVVLVLAAFVVTVASTNGRAPLWVAVLILTIIELMHVLPIQ